MVYSANILSGLTIIKIVFHSFNYVRHMFYGSGISSIV